MRPRAIDWDAIRHRLAVAADAVARGVDHGPEEVRRILETRARLAATPSARPDRAEQLEVVGFSLAAEAYAVETRYVSEVCPLRNLTVLPCAPSFVVGVMSLRGRILAIVDLCKFFELPAKGLTELNRIIVLRGADDELGLLADSIAGVRVVATSELQAGLPTLTGIRERFLKGVTGEMLTVLDGDALLGHAGLKVEEQ